MRPYICNCDGITTYEKINIMGNNGINIAAFLSVVALGIKFTKHWYMQQVQNRLLGRQKITRQLKLLKSRIQPEFLFESLQILYLKISSDKNQAAQILLKLSELLSYMLYEGIEDLVPLERELFIIHEFIALENLMQQKKINFINNIANNPNQKYIPSFTLLAFIQNCVIAQQNEAPEKLDYFSLKLEVDDINLYCKMVIKFENLVTKRKYAGITDSFINRLETVYKNNYTIEFSEIGKNELSIKMMLLLSDSMPVYKVEDEYQIPYVYAG